MELLDALLQRPVFITFAIIGAILATLGNHLLRSGRFVNPDMARLILRAGYGCAGFSVLIFIAAGFRQ